MLLENKNAVVHGAAGSVDVVSYFAGEEITADGGTS
jgi:hypothetical protein